MASGPAACRSVAALVTLRSPRRHQGGSAYSVSRTVAAACGALDDKRAAKAVGGGAVPALTQHMRQVLRQQPVLMVATSDSQGQPNVSPKGALQVLGDDQIVFADLCSRKTRSNLQANQRLAVAAVDPATYEGYQFKGWAEVLRSGPVYDEVCDLLARSEGGPRPMELWFEKAARELVSARSRAGQNGEHRPSQVVVLHIDEIWNLAPGNEGEVWRLQA